MSRLLCEGVPSGPDAVVLAALLAPDGPEVEPSISKTRLGAGVHALRRIGRMCVAAIRDRDFDFHPRPGDDPVEWKWDSEPVGWHWRRHELESYLVDPVLVVPATIAIAPDVDVVLYGDILERAARTITAYQAARWTLGEVRQRLPRRLPDRPERFGKDFDLPSDLGAESCLTWVHEELGAHRTTIPEASMLEKSYQAHLDRFTAATFGVAEVLLWFSGKDLMGSVARQAKAEGLTVWQSAGALRNMVRDWIRDHPEEALRLVPEWARFKSMLNE